MAINCTKYGRRTTDDGPLTGRHLRNKRVLITAGPTWVPVDSVRVISNTATGATGIVLAQKLQRLGAKVTLLLGPVEACCLNKGIRVLRFKFFDELYRIFRHELRAGKYDIVIHSAAVSDYRPVKACREKIKSGLAVLNIRLVPTPKIIECVKKVSPHIFLVGFKFRPEAAKNEIIKEGRSLMVSAPADLVVANTITKGKYRAYILDRRGAKGPFSGRMSLAAGLVSYLKAARIK